VLNLWVAPVGKLEQAKVVTVETKRPLRRYAWANTSKHLLYMQDIGGDENFHVFRVDLAGGKATDLTPYPGARAEIAGMSEKQPTKVVVSVNNRDPKAMDLHIVDLLTGTSTMLAENTDGFLGFTVDLELRPRIATKKLTNGDTQVFTSEGKGAPAWKLFDTIAFEDADTTNILGIAPGGKSIYMQETPGREPGPPVLQAHPTKKQKLLPEDPP